MNANMTIAKCKICNADLKQDDKFCSDCGAGIAAQTVSQPQSQLGSQPVPQSQHQVREQQINQPPQPQVSQASQPLQSQYYQAQQQIVEPVSIPVASGSVQGVPATYASDVSDAKKSKTTKTNAGKTKDNTQLSVFGYVITMLALSVPVLGIILVFVWAFGSKTNLARKNYSRAIFVISGIFLVLIITGFILNYNALMGLMRVLME